MAQTAEIIGDKWTLLILREAFYGVIRYDDMLQDLEVSRSTLTDRLNKLVRQGLMEKRPYQEAGNRLRHYYALTQSGRALIPLFIAMTQWGEDHILNKPAPIKIIDQKTGSDVKLSLHDKNGQDIEFTQLSLAKRP